MTKPLYGKTLVLAHRGASAYYPENTMPAFEAAVDMKSDGFELDVHLSADGEVVITHDTTLDRVTNKTSTGPVAQKTYAELLACDVSAQFHETMKSVRMPRLDDVYRLIADTDLIVNVEIKAEGRPLLEKLLALEDEYGMRDRIIYSSFNHFNLTELQKMRSDITVAPLYFFNMVAPWLYTAIIGAQAVHPHYKQLFLLPEYVTECHRRKIAVNTWTVDDPDTAKQLADMGVDAIITNKPDLIRDTLGYRA
ncbi:MAG: glycerophosphodiester phosphodiesterase [Clostridiales bacterium]|nr:glycerophosphodiester phosphodiesterase [Clostridiales bacterium]